MPPEERLTEEVIRCRQLLREAAKPGLDESEMMEKMEAARRRLETLEMEVSA
jgi:hypothetical protein